MSDIKRLSEVIAFSMGDKKKTPEDVATLCMCAASLVNAWLAGTAVPDRQRWGFLCSRLDRSLFTYGSLHGAALAELAGRPAVHQSPASVGSGLLGTKLVEALTRGPDAAALTKTLYGSPITTPEAPVTPAEAPKEVPEPDPAAVRREARSAQTSKALLALPAGWRSRENIGKRESFARRFFRAKPHANLAECAEALDKEFGVGIGSTSLSRIRDEERRVVEAGSTDPALRDVSDEPLSTEPARGGVIDMPRTGQGNTELLASVAPPAPTVDDQLQVAIEIVLEAVPHLAEMTISRSPSGEVSYKVVEAKVVETTGRMVRPR